MLDIYTWNTLQATRSVTIAGMRAQKGKRKLAQVTANTEEEAAAAAAADLDMIICNCHNVERVRAGNNTLFLTAAIPFPYYATNDDLVREAFRTLECGADAVMTAHGVRVVEMLANKDIPVMGHLSLVTHKEIWTDDLLAKGKTAVEAYDLYKRFKILEDAGAAIVEAGEITKEVMEEISKHSDLITVSLGSGGGADVIYLFMEEVCGDSPNTPRHGCNYANFAKFRAKIKEERIRALKEFKKDAMSGDFPSHMETVSVDDEELSKFRELLQQAEK